MKEYNDVPPEIVEPLDTSLMSKEEQVAFGERLQGMWLRRMERLLITGHASSTDMATLMRFLASNGWTLDPSKLPQGLRGMLTSTSDPREFDDDDGVIGKIA